jgi:hypothetical protein
MNGDEWTICTRCNGSKFVRSIIENRDFRCPGCGGHGRLPVGGVHWFKRDHGDGNPRIASLTMEPDGRWRVTFFTPRGPLSHSIEKATAIMDDLSGFVHDPAAANELDRWSLTAEWREGVAHLTWRALEDVLVPILGWSVVSQLRSFPISERVREGFILKRALCPKAAIW